MAARSRDPVLSEVGRRIRQARLRAKLSQEAASRAAHIDYKRWQTIEKGEANLTIQTLDRVATAIGLDFWGLMRRPTAMDPPELRKGRRPSES